MTRIPTLATLAAAITVTTVLSACSGGGSHAAGATTSTPSAPASGGTFRGGPPGTSGQIAEIDGNTLQVQNAETGQVAVEVTSSTRYTQTVNTTLAAVTVGSCVVATQETSGTPSTPSTQTSPPTGPRTITATRVTITAPNSSGSCGGTFGGTRKGAPTDLPSTKRTLPPGGGGFARAFGDVVAGKVTAVDGTTLSVQAEQRTPNSTSTTSVTDTVTVTSSTTYTHTVGATKSALKVGLCVNATGSTASDGTVTASRVAISAPDANGCAAGIGRFGGAVAGGPGGQ